MKAVQTILILICAVATLTLVVLTGALALATQPERFRWVAEEELADGRNVIRPVCEVDYLERPIITLSTIADLARTAVLQTNEFDYLNWPRELPIALGKYFSPNAARIFMAQFERSALLQSVQTNYYTVSAIPNGSPVVIEVFAPPPPRLREWRVHVPIRLIYQTGAYTQAGRETEFTSNVLFEVRVSDQPPSPTNFRGIAVIGVTLAQVERR